MLCHKPLQMKSQPVFPLVQKCNYWYQFYFFFFFNNSFVVTTYWDHFMCFDFFSHPLLQALLWCGHTATWTMCVEQIFQLVDIECYIHVLIRTLTAGWLLPESSPLIVFPDLAKGLNPKCDLSLFSRDAAWPAKLLPTFCVLFWPFSVCERASF